MAHSFKVNFTPATGAVAIFDGLLKTAVGVLKLQSWTRPKDSDGTTYDPAGAQLTTGAAGAGGLGNVDAWFVVEDPGGVRQFMFQRKADNQTWTIKYSAAAKFTGGMPDATTPATAADSVTILDNGVLFPSAEGAYQFNAIGGDATVGYAFDFFGWDTGDSNANVFEMLLEVMKVGSFDAAQADPAVIYLTAAGTATDFVASTKTNGFILDGVETWTTCYPFSYYSEQSGNLLAPGTTATRGSGVDPWGAKDTTLPIIYGATAFQAHPAIKGQGLLCKYASTWRVTTTVHTLNLDGGAKNALVLFARVLPWPTATDPVI